MIAKTTIKLLFQDSDISEKRYIFNFKGHGSCIMTGAELLGLSSIKRSLTQEDFARQFNDDSETTNSNTPNMLNMELQKEALKLVISGQTLLKKPVSVVQCI
jgi:hypothetical protein